MTDIRVALVGYGMAGRQFHAPLLRAVDGMHLTHVVTGDPERAAAARDECDGAVVVGSLEALWSASDDLDLVVLASPTKVHADQALQAVRRGLAVVVDKPLTVTAAEAREVAAAAATNGVLLSVFQNRRWDPEHLTAKAVLAAGTLGELVRYEARYERWRPVPKDRWREHSTSADGGGIILDLQSHLVDSALDLLGPAVSVYAETAAFTTVGEDVAFLALRHASGVVSHLGTTSLAGAPGPRTRLLGRDGTYLVAGIDQDPTALSAWADPDADHRGWLLRGEEAEPVRRAPGEWADYYIGVRDALAGGGSPPVTAEEAVAVMTVLDAARRSAAGNAVVTLS